jgi:hypothetical protein
MKAKNEYKHHFLVSLWEFENQIEYELYED